MNKKQLYESIMKEVSKNVKAALNEAYAINKGVAMNEFISAFLKRYPTYDLCDNQPKDKYSICFINEFNEVEKFYFKYNCIYEQGYKNANFTFKTDEIEKIENYDYVVCYSTKTYNAYILKTDLFLNQLYAEETMNYISQHRMDKSLNKLDVKLIPQFMLRREIIKCDELNDDSFINGTMFNCQQR